MLAFVKRYWKHAAGTLLLTALSCFLWPQSRHKSPPSGPQFTAHATAPTGTPTLGTIAANGAAVAVSTGNTGSLGIDVAGTWSGTLAAQVLINSAWTTISIIPVNGGAAVTSTTANGTWTANVAGSAQCQIVATAWSSGTATVTLNPSIAGGGTSTSTVSGTVTTSSGSQTPTTVTLQSSAVANANGTTASTSGYGGVYQLLIANGAGTCTVNVEGSLDNFATAQNVFLIGVIQLSNTTGAFAETVNTSRSSVSSGAISVAANTSYIYTLSDYYPYIRARISSAAGLGAGTNLTGCSCTLTALPQ